MRGPGFKKSALLALRSSITRQSQVLERHEKRVADHTVIQTYTGIINLAVSAITTIVLIYVAYQQYRVSAIQANVADREVKLQYAQAEPYFTFQVDKIFSAIDIYAERPWMPRKVTTNLSRGLANIKNVQLIQDINVFIIDEQRRNDHYNCLIRVRNYWEPENLGAIQTSNIFAQKVMSNPYRRMRNNRYFIGTEPKNTWAIVKFNDVFGEEESIIYGGIGELQRYPGKEIPTSDYIYGIATADIPNLSNKYSDRKWLYAETNDPDCKFILSKYFLE
jgi:hypothetical protein